MKKTLSGTCACGYTCSNLVFGEVDDGIFYDLDVCYSCEQLFSVEVSTPSFMELPEETELSNKQHLCPSCNEPGFNANVVEYYAPDSGKKTSSTAVRQLSSKLFSRLKEPEYICYCPECGRHRLMLFGDG